MSGHKTKFRNRRSTDRKVVELPGILIIDDAAEPCTIYDISPRGAKVSASERAQVDAPIRLKLTELGEFIGRVVWRRGDTMGVEFVHLDDDLTFAGASSGPDIRLVH